jgi:predicted metal-dependent HD superfamily phosphohydrolase
MQITLLQQFWDESWKEINDKPAPQQAFAQLLNQYSEPHRKYHTLEHIHECLLHAERIKHLTAHYDEIIIALWFHDAIYDTHRLDNEEQSANQAKHCLEAARVADDKINRIVALILATRHNQPPQTADEALLVDIDLAILGADPKRFQAYETQIQEEYSFVPESLFNAKRTEIIQGFLSRDRLYETDYFRASHENQAQMNLRHSIALIQANPPAPQT